MSLSNNPSDGGGTENLYQLKWTHYQNFMVSGLSSLLEDGELLDVTLASEGKFIKAHKMALALCSPFFKDFFKLNGVDKTNGNCLVALANIRFKELESIIRFIYYGEVKVRRSEVKDFLDAAKELKIQGLDTPMREIKTDKSGASSPSVPRVVTSSQSQSQNLGESTTAGPSLPKRSRMASSSSHVPVSNTTTKIINIKLLSSASEISESSRIQEPTSESTSEHDPLEDRGSPAEDDDGEDDEEMINFGVVKCERVEVRDESNDEMSMVEGFDPGESLNAPVVNDGSQYQMSSVESTPAPGPSSSVRQSARGSSSKSSKPGEKANSKSEVLKRQNPDFSKCRSAVYQHFTWNSELRVWKCKTCPKCYEHKRSTGGSALTIHLQRKHPDRAASLKQKRTLSGN